MKARRYQTTDDVIARAASGQPQQPPGGFRGTSLRILKGWAVAGCVIGALVILAGLALALG